MIEIMRSNDPVQLSFAEALLRDAGIAAVLLDSHMSILDGSINAIPRRLMVADAAAGAARQLLRDADLPVKSAGDA